MIAHAIFFYFFSIIAILSAIMVVVSRNTVHAVFFLILDFISIGCLFIMVGAEFLGMMMLIVYVGAVAVLFLFVVMIMNVSEQKLSWLRGSRKSNHIPVGLVISFVILLDTPRAYSDYSVHQHRILPPNVSIDEITHDSKFHSSSITAEMVLEKVKKFI